MQIVQDFQKDVRCPSWRCLSPIIKHHLRKAGLLMREENQMHSSTGGVTSSKPGLSYWGSSHLLTGNPGILIMGIRYTLKKTYYWVGDHPLLYEIMGGLDPGTSDSIISIPSLQTSFQCSSTYAYTTLN